MRKLDLADITRLAAELQAGETIELVSEGRTVARVEPVRERRPLPTDRPPTDDEILDDLVARGLVTKRGSGNWPDWFFTRERPTSPDGSVLEQLLADRKSRDW
ncbi:MAG TPA: hypothetical protein VHW00_00400 [Thermoanaerobaculia bacterium]|nr:hypothetical protein [Thermoanaerobaculia bacterium]